MREVCKKNDECKQALCLDIACEDFEPDSRLNPTFVIEELERRVEEDVDAAKLFLSEPLLYRFHKGLEVLGDDPKFIVAFVLEIMKLKARMQEELFKLAANNVKKIIVA